MSKKELRCAHTGVGGARCRRSVSAEWTCAGCDELAGEKHCQSVVFGNFGDHSTACLCYECLAGLPEDEPVAAQADLAHLWGHAPAHAAAWAGGIHTAGA
jgi:hypothetical protein